MITALAVTSCQQRLAAMEMPSRQSGTAQPVGLVFCLRCFVSFQEVVQLSQEGLAINAMDHTGLFNGFTAGSGSAKAVHADGKEQGSGVGCNFQHVADDGSLFNLNSHDNDLLFSSSRYIITVTDTKDKRELPRFSKKVALSGERATFVIRFLPVCIPEYPPAGNPTHRRWLPEWRSGWR